MNHATRFTNVCACQITGICAIIYVQKSILNYFVLEMAAIIVAGFDSFQYTVACLFLYSLFATMLI